MFTKDENLLADRPGKRIEPPAAALSISLSGIRGGRLFRFLDDFLAILKVHQRRV